MVGLFANISNTTLPWRVNGQQKKVLEWKDRKEKEEKNWDESEHVMARDTLMRRYTVVVVVVGFKNGRHY